VPFYFPGGALPLKKKSVLNVIKLMGKHFIDPKSSEILSIDIPALLKSWKKH
jgi:hypothetical protein